MTKNMGTVDRAVRVLIAIIVAVLYFTGQIGGVLAGVLGALSLVFVLTSLMGSCPLYRPFGINTR
jgi:Inner membrane protein YgaP-like, transmembrane domain